MPYLKLNTNVKLSADQSMPLMTALSKLLAQETGKPERYVLVELNADTPMLMAGNAQPLAYLECKSIGLTTTQANTLSAEIAKLLDTHLFVSADRIYIEFKDCQPAFWGWNASTFA